MTTTDLRYPIGRFTRPASLDAPARRDAMRRLLATPAQLRLAVLGLDAGQLDTPYREGGWTVRQLVHHVADSHMNMYVRFKLGLTEERPTIKPYDENAWAQLADVAAVPVELSLQALDAVHARLDAVLRPLDERQWARTIVHPENGEQRLDQLLALYAWHGEHHVAHVTALRARMGW